MVPTVVVDKVAEYVPLAAVKAETVKKGDALIDEMFDDVAIKNWYDVMLGRLEGKPVPLYAGDRKEMMPEMDKYAKFVSVKDKLETS